MNHGIKLSKPGYDVMSTGSTNSKDKTTNATKTLPHMIAVLALPYLYGASNQTKRYKTAASRLNRDPVSVMSCLHEASNLFEDLDTVDRYAQMCGKEHSLHMTILHIRNHIRHDIRDNLEHESDKRRIDRARKLNMPEHLITSVGFTPAAINVGNTEVKIRELEKFLLWAEDIFAEVIDEATKKGLLEGIKVNSK